MKKKCSNCGSSDWGLYKRGKKTPVGFGGEIVYKPDEFYCIHCRKIEKEKI